MTQHCFLPKPHTTDSTCRPNTRPTSKSFCTADTLNCRPSFPPSSGDTEPQAPAIKQPGISQLCKNNLLHTVYPSNILPLCLLSFLCLFPAIVSAVPQYQRLKAVSNRSNKYESQRSYGYPKSTRTVAHSFWLQNKEGTLVKYMAME